MKRYQIREVAENNNDAGTKATKDVAIVAQQLGFESVYIKMRTTSPSKIAKIQRQIGWWKDWKDAYKKIPTDAVVLLQNPFHYPQLIREKMLRKLKKNRNVKYISVVHDVEELRKFRYNKYYEQEFNAMLELADVLIVHNDRMAEFFKKKGVKADKLVNLQIFDYLQDSVPTQKPQFAKQITVAGNLDVKKCGYIGQLHQIKGIDIQLYGSNFNEELKKYSNIHYGGSLPPDEIPQRLDRGFGLVWDGTSIDGCKGDAGQYLKYNNPHKLSLYLSSGLPVVIWSKAAEAEFVKTNHVGILVDSLLDLPNQIAQLTEEAYHSYVENVQSISKKLVQGEFEKKAINSALCCLDKKE